MIQENDKEQWVEKMLGNIQDPGNAIPSPYLFSKITNSIRNKNATTKQDRHFLVMAGVGLLVFCVLNIFVLTIYISKSSTSVSQEVAKEYFGSETLTGLY
jgi:p-aminobenzoyl-glutamate transporter AbgT